MRKYFIDNVRWACVLLLFPYHTFMVYNTFGESFYVKGADIAITSKFISAAWPWIMPLMFLTAGVSSAYALQRKTPRQYLKERVSRLLIPLIFGILLLVPIQTYFAEMFHNGYKGGYLAQYILFFTKPTDLSGYSGGFTPAHLWFILYLFIISLITLPIMAAYNKAPRKLPLQKTSLPVLLLLFIIPMVSQIVLDISGKSLGEYTAFFLLGFFLCSADTVQDKLAKHRFTLLSLSLAAGALYVARGSTIAAANLYLYETLYAFYAWVTILAILSLAKRYFNFTNSVSSYLAQASFSIYVFHQQWIVVTAYYTLLLTDIIPLQMLIIILSSLVLTLLTYEIFKRVSVTRFMFGIKK